MAVVVIKIEDIGETERGSRYDVEAMFPDSFDDKNPSTAESAAMAFLSALEQAGDADYATVELTDQTPPKPFDLKQWRRF
jgi:hypothetical protein